MPYTGWNPPADRCRECHRPARPHDMTCSDACDLQRRLRDELPHDARSLAVVALSNTGADGLQALYRLRYVWRSRPDAYETALRDAAIDLLLSEYVTDEEAQAWQQFTDHQVPALAASLRAHHDYRNANRQDIAA